MPQHKGKDAARTHLSIRCILPTETVSNSITQSVLPALTTRVAHAPSGEKNEQERTADCLVSALGARPEMTHMRTSQLNTHVNVEARYHEAQHAGLVEYS